MEIQPLDDMSYRGFVPYESRALRGQGNNLGTINAMPPFGLRLYRGPAKAKFARPTTICHLLSSVSCLLQEYAGTEFEWIMVSAA